MISGAGTHTFANWQNSEAHRLNIAQAPAALSLLVSAIFGLQVIHPQDASNMDRSEILRRLCRPTGLKA
ncbi:MAG: hypothetical protein E6447_23825 [Bradyrhizobium sp.]|nr:hypothetical protein [Bradyrhizobium sp.]